MASVAFACSTCGAKGTVALPAGGAASATGKPVAVRCASCKAENRVMLASAPPRPAPPPYSESYGAPAPPAPSTSVINVYNVTVVQSPPAPVAPAAATWAVDARWGGYMSEGRYGVGGSAQGGAPLMHHGRPWGRGEGGSAAKHGFAQGLICVVCVCMCVCVCLGTRHRH